MNKEDAWNYGLGMIKIDGLTPSKEFFELIEAEKNGEINDQDILNKLDEKYKKYMLKKGE